MMGNILSSDTDDKNESVINLSDNCVNRVTKEEKKCASSTPDKLADGEWVKKLKCMDDIHSQENGLTYQCLLDLIKRVEVQLHDLRPPVCEYEGCLNLQSGQFSMGM
ncbi:hypothetical protein NQ315_013968 [Exocentrus adspersus]|uniref:Hair keratin-like claw keratin HA1 n=1 Tax=Exocentrus adspersus TaxID=1586481 RepID=A0AAV8VR84_9CUCU|nr:hypothetical protein NQ315_013968 [Exocentrus adspersus]